MARVAEEGYIRIGELSRRLGISPELLRAWERRYGLLRPGRSAGRFRLYSDADVARVQAMKENLARGLSAAEAARLALEAPVAEEAVQPHEPLLRADAAALADALDAFDGTRAQAALDRLLAAFSVETVLRDVVLPLLRELGERWARGAVTVAQEHFASNLLRGRLLAIARGWSSGNGPHALLAAPSGELHDLGLVVFGVALRERGWRITFLGADTPVETLADAARRLEPRAIVVSALSDGRFRSARPGLRELAAARRVLVAGAGASAELANELGAELLDQDPIGAAESLAS
jgi:DNA-binding transcriptional MerR regulator